MDDITKYNRGYEQGKQDMKKEIIAWAERWNQYGLRSSKDDPFLYAMDVLIEYLNETEK